MVTGCRKSISTHTCCCVMCTRPEKPLPRARPPEKEWVRVDTCLKQLNEKRVRMQHHVDSHNTLTHLLCWGDYSAAPWQSSCALVLRPHRQSHRPAFCEQDRSMVRQKFTIIERGAPQPYILVLLFNLIGNLYCHSVQARDVSLKPCQICILLLYDLLHSAIRQSSQAAC